MTARTGTPAAERELVITRDLDAPPSRVFQAWTEPQHFVRWWGPNGFTTPFCKIDLCPGGVLHYCMRSPKGQDFWGKGIFSEIVPPKRLVFTDSFADEQGNPVPASHYGMASDWPAETLVTVVFAEHQGKTRLTLRHSGIPSGKDGEMTETGWKESVERLAGYLAKA
jgi:uncharacterized protein YndB with AHSA1/START domain